MVYSFIVHTLIKGSHRILYSTVFAPEGCHSQTTGGDIVSFGTESESESYNSDATASGIDLNHSDSVGVSSDGRERRKTWMLLVAEEVRSAYRARVMMSSRSYEHDYLTLQNEGVLPEFELGYFRFSLRTTDDGNANEDQQATAVPEDKVVVWLGALNCAFTLVCEKIENRMLAEVVLKLIIKYLHEYVRPLLNPNHVVQKADRVTMVIRQFLPAGRLLPMNHRLVQQFEKELETNMKS